jgi:uracil-DNA glycosylase
VEGVCSVSFPSGYPSSCILCSHLVEDSLNVSLSLKVRPFYQKGTSQHRLMLIGQDPNIRRNPDKVKDVLMLDQPNSPLSRWLRQLIGEHNFDSTTIYATNVVKCTLGVQPSSSERGSEKFLTPFFEKCRVHLEREIVSYKPTVVLTLGEPTHRLFMKFIGKSMNVSDTMQGAFTGNFTRVTVSDGKELVDFDYSPCLHINTFRVAEVYGDSVKQFKNGVKGYFE